jgi:RNA polymerase sigma-70 factor (ECF subfamily)
MTDSTSTPDWDLLLKHSGWVRALAENLVSDASAAEDIEQQAWLKAAEKPPRHKTNLRAWLATLVRSKAGMHWRRQRPTSSFIEELDGAGACESVVERMDTVRNLAAAVAGLPEPYASAIYMRYFEELSVREVAERQGVPLNTAQTRLSRGLDKLRIKLEGSLGADWRNQCLVFAAPLSAAPSVALGTTTAIVMTAKTKLILAAALVLMASLGVLQPWETQEADFDSPSVQASLDTHAAAASADLPTDVVVQRSEFEISTNEGSSTSSFVSPVEELVIRVVDGVTLEPIPNAEVLFFDHASRSVGVPNLEEFDHFEKARSNAEERMQIYAIPLRADASGNLHVPRPSASFELSSQAQGKFGWIMANALENGKRGAIELPVFSVQQLRVRVLHENGEPAEGITVGFIPYSADTVAYQTQSQQTDREGRAVFSHLELDLMTRYADLVSTVAVAVPAIQPQLLEFLSASPPVEEIVFHLPALGSVEVECRDSEGQPLPDGSMITLAAGPPPLENPGFIANLASMKNGRCAAAVKNGVAKFPYVGVGTELVAENHFPGLSYQALVAGKGPSAAGELVSLSLVMEAIGPPLVVQLVGADGAPIPSMDLFVDQWDMDFVGAQQHEYSWRPVLENGRVELKVDWAGKKGVKHLGLAVRDDDGHIEGRSDFSLTHFPFSTEDLGAEQEPLVVPYGGELIVAGRCQDEQGVGIPGMEIVLKIFPSGQPVGWKERTVTNVNVKSDRNGDFRIFGSLDTQYFRAELHLDSDRVRSNQSRSQAIPFELGQRNLVIVRPGQTEIRGRVLVDDPAFLDFLRAHVLTYDAKMGSRFTPGLKLDKPNGRFRKRGALRTQQRLVVKDRSTGEELGGIENPFLQPDSGGGSLAMPELDLRGALYFHTLDVVDIEGVTIENPRVEFTTNNRRHFIRKWNTAGFLSLQPQLDLAVSAPGYRKKEITSQGGVSTVMLEEGIEVHISLPSGRILPEHETWSVRLWKTVDGKMVGSGVENYQEITPGTAELIFVLDEPGEWGVVLNRSVRVNQDDRHWQEKQWYPFRPDQDWHPINVEDVSTRQSFVLPVTAEGFESMLE